MKTRIKCVTYGDGSVVYFAQVRVWGFWKYYLDWWEEPKRFYTKKEVEKFIDARQAEHTRYKITAKTYIKYP